LPWSQPGSPACRPRNSAQTVTFYGGQLLNNNNPGTRLAYHSQWVPGFCFPSCFLPSFKKPGDKVQKVAQIEKQIKRNRVSKPKRA